MSDSIDKKIQNELEDFIEIRHHLHRHPELSFQESNTSKYISDKLREYGIQHQTGIAGTGIIGIIRGKNPDKRIIALRADMDALPINEENDTVYTSQNEGVMHACGHDVHSTCLLGAAKILQDTREDWQGTVKLIFQPGEEKHPGGASLMIKEGVLENPKPQAIFALHVYPHLPYGKLGFRAGQYMASADEIYITVKGKGGHAALPHQTIDPIVIASQIILSLQTVISRRHNGVASPSVLSFGKIQGGGAGNIIPDEVRIEGTLRCMDESWRKEAWNLIQTQAEQIARAMGGDAVVKIPEGYPYLINDEQTTQRAVELAENLFGIENIVRLDKRMAAEDFSFYTHHVPGCFFRLGTSFEGRFETPVHHPKFDIYEEAIGLGIKILYTIAVNF